jgi:ribosome-associated toxin RatA of RatAB toxin-antitoxin module
MRKVHVTLDLPDAEPEAVFDGVRRFADYPSLAPDVRAVTAREDSSDWEVYFRNGILRWTEDDTFDRGSLTITFAQDDGDFDDFHGRWTLAPRDGGGCRVDFDAQFDFGIPSLVGILDPVAERVIKEVIALVVRGLFPGAEVVGDEKLTRALAALAAQAH